MRIISDEDLLSWYQHIQTYNNGKIDAKVYCENNNLNYCNFKNMKWRIDLENMCASEKYEKFISIAREFHASGKRLKQFAEEKKIAIPTLTKFQRHLNYRNRLAQLLPKREETSMSFIQVPSGQSRTIDRPASPPIQEVLEKQNDLEITISKGVKVSISPNIDSMKILKIIELLKDL